jgi:putative sigma-54 modulation protein
MNIKVVGKNIEITEAIREYIEKRFEKFEKFELDNSEITVSCSVEREEQIVDIQINKSGDFIRIEERNNDLYASIDLAIDRVARQLRKDKEKKLDKSRNESLKDKIMGIFKDETPDRAGEITKTKVYEAKPLSIEDAKLKLMDKKEDLFIVFNNVETNEINVLYKREDGSFGIVVPE